PRPVGSAQRGRARLLQPQHRYVGALLSEGDLDPQLRRPPGDAGPCQAVRHEGVLWRHPRHGGGRARPRRHAGDARQSARAAGKRSDQHADSDPRHAACAIGADRADRIRPHRRAGTHHDAHFLCPSVGGPLGHDRRDAGAVLLRRRQLDLCRRYLADGRKSRGRGGPKTVPPARIAGAVKKSRIAVSYDFIKESVKVCMFDQYGTVVDMQGGLTAIATPFLKAKGWSGDPNSFVTWWRRTHFENSMIDALLHRAHTPYREIGHRAVAHVMDRAGIGHSREDVRYLVGEIEKLKPFPEVPAALDKLHTRYKLVVLSNGDPDMLETAKKYHGIAFDRVISVAEANSFKPHVATYTKAAELLGLKLEQILFVANHAFDCIGAKSAGRRAAFIERRSRPFGETPPQPDILVPTMKDLAEAIV